MGFIKSERSIFWERVYRVAFDKYLIYSVAGSVTEWMNNSDEKLSDTAKDIIKLGSLV